jgi:hypothetical protein
VAEGVRGVAGAGGFYSVLARLDVAVDHNALDARRSTAGEQLPSVLHAGVAPLAACRTTYALQVLCHSWYIWAIMGLYASGHTWKER